MSESQAPSDATDRRRSLLPQRTNRTSIYSNAAAPGQAARRSSEQLGDAKAGTPSQPAQRRSSMMPPPSTRPLSSKPASIAARAALVQASSTSQLHHPSGLRTKDGMERLPKSVKAVPSQSGLTENLVTRRASLRQQSSSRPTLNSSRVNSTRDRSGERKEVIRPPSITRRRFSSLQEQNHLKQSKPLAKDNEVETLPANSLTDSTQTQPTDGLQLEILQLHLLHRSAESVQHQWETSAKHALVGVFDELRARHTEMRDVSQQQKQVLNQLALAEWCQGKPSSQLAEKIQQASKNFGDVNDLLAPQGKFTHILGVFEAWLANALHIREARDSSSANPQAGFIQGIGDGWKAETMVLERELTYCLRELKAFGDMREASSLGHLLSLHKTLVMNLLEELDSIQWIENTISDHEHEWMDAVINKLSASIETSI